MKLKTFAVIILAIVAMQSCKKKEDNSNTAIENAKIHTITETVAGTIITSTYSYKTDGSIDRVDVSNGSSYIYHYFTDMIIEMSYDVSGTLIDSFTYFLNSSGYIDSSVLVNSGSYSYNKLLYNANGQVTTRRNYDATHFLQSQWSATISDENIIVWSITDVNGNGLQQINYNYDYEHISSINAKNYGQTFAGKGSKNLLKDSQTIINGGGGVSFVYQYTFDSGGRVESMQTFNPGGTLISTRAYTYY